MKQNENFKIDEIIDRSGINRYQLVHRVAKRAKQIKDATQPDLDRPMPKAVMQALREIVEDQMANLSGAA